MLILMTLMLQVVTPAPSPPTAIAPVPMNAEAWRGMDARAKLRYADATIQGLRRNPVIARCERLTPSVMVAGLDRDAKPGEPLMMAVAKTAYGTCP